MPGPDLPAPEELFTVDAYWHRWPSGARKAELVDGVLVFSGEFDKRDVAIARNAYPGRQVLLNDGGGIEIHPTGETPPRSIYETYLERHARAASDSGLPRTTDDEVEHALAAESGEHQPPR